MRRPGWGLSSRLFAAQALALATGALTAAVVAALLAPPLFHAHLLEAGLEPGEPGLQHIEKAFLDAGVVSLGVGLVTALIAAMGVSWYVTSRIRRPLDQLTGAAERLGRGDYSTRVEASGAGPEIATLGSTFNTMAERLDTIEVTRRRLLADVAHEMRTPLATLNAQLEALTDGVNEWDEDTRRVLTQQGDRLTRLARDIDDVSRAEEGRIPLETGDHDVALLLEDALGHHRAAFARKGVSLAGDLHPARAVVDPQRFAQLVSNLLTNALRHTPGGGRVSVTCRRAAQTAVIEVTDTGDGMSPEQLGHAFERFYRGDTARDRDHGGSGIGLTIARALAEAHGGSLTASSPGLGAGSTFRLTLPTPGA